ncbi:thiamin pyrophosphokinase 1-like [Dysidea avara]|uniref:thiamin pyrophosphokinase 1-like n=1 Tax=Dysidea avara TaxID=196820 RepID=UPI00331C37EC
MSLRTIQDCLQSREHHQSLAIVICNAPLSGLEGLVKKIWTQCELVVCADGGSNRLYDSMKEDRNKYVPHVICGDLDSIRKEVVQFYKEKGSDVVQVDDQDTTDLTKCFNHITHLNNTGIVKVDNIVVMNAASWGRFDQIIGNINSLFLIAAPPILLSDDSLVTLLPPGQHHIPVNTGLEEGHCGLIPIAGAVQSVTTSGLKWNLNKDAMSFGTLISTSNLILPGAKEVTVETTGTLLWTMSHKLSNL